MFLFTPDCHIKMSPCVFSNQCLQLHQQTMQRALCDRSIVHSALKVSTNSLVRPNYLSGFARQRQAIKIVHVLVLQSFQFMRTIRQHKKGDISKEKVLPLSLCCLLFLCFCLFCFVFVVDVVVVVL